MAIGDIIVGMDIGTSKVSIVIGEVNNFNQIEVIYTDSQKCRGIKKGKIIDEDEIVLAVTKLIKNAEIDANLTINSTYITIPGKYVTIVQNSILKDAKDRYAGISMKDVSASIMQVSDIDIPEGKQIIDIVTDRFILENGRIVQDPVGSLSSSFTLKAQIILADKEYIKKITNILKRAYIEIDGLVPVTLAERCIALDSNELGDNIMLLDIGAGNTDIGVFEGSSFVYTNTIPLGGDNITNDIALVLDISEEEADKLKKQYGLAMKSFIDNDNEILLSTCKDENRKIIKSSEGIKQRINNVILTGQGITNINKSDVAGKIALNIPVKISTGRLISTVRPEYRTAYALVRYISSRAFAKNVSSSIETKSNENILHSILERIKEFFYS